MNISVLEIANNQSQQDLTGPEWTGLKAFLEANAIEKHPAWKGKMNQQTIADFLTKQYSLPYVLSQDSPNEYFLSYIRDHDHKVIHIRFKVVFDHKLGRYGYRNGTSIIFPSLNALIRYKMKGKGLFPKAALLRRSA